MTVAGNASRASLQATVVLSGLRLALDPSFGQLVGGRRARALMRPLDRSRSMQSKQCRDYTNGGRRAEPCALWL